MERTLVTEPKPQLISLSIRPMKGEIRLTAVILAFQLCFYPFLWMMPEDQMPDFLLWSFRFILFWAIFEMTVMLSKPVALNVDGDCLQANYLLGRLRRQDTKERRDLFASGPNGRDQ